VGDEPAHLYKAQRDGVPVLIKFASCYGVDVHEAWARKGCAVQLLN
jgi:hypothetical protein